MTNNIFEIMHKDRRVARIDSSSGRCKIYYKSFDNEQDGIIWMDKIYDKLLKTRIQFKSKYELNKYIKEKAS